MALHQVSLGLSCEDASPQAMASVSPAQSPLQKCDHSRKDST
jgi:hypothetical protein